MLNFNSIDFETADSTRFSPCELAIVQVRDGLIIGEHRWKIKPPCWPYFDDFNIDIHGLGPKDVEDSPTFDQLWPEIKEYFEGQLVVAHNASFDISVLCQTLAHYQIEAPSLRYICSYITSKHSWPGHWGYGLDALCYTHKIRLNHHNALSDAKATAKLFLLALESLGVDHLEDLESKTRIRIGVVDKEIVKRCHSHRDRNYETSKLSLITGDSSKHNQDCLFYGKSVVFTGTLSIQRKMAAQLIADIGGVNLDRLTSTADFLVVGQQDIRIVGEDGMSRKQEQAIRMIEKGSSLEIISELDFFRFLNQ